MQEQIKGAQDVLKEIRAIFSQKAAAAREARLAANAASGKAPKAKASAAKTKAAPKKAAK